jgi:hypothetical protein
MLACSPALQKKTDLVMRPVNLSGLPALGQMERKNASRPAEAEIFERHPITLCETVTFAPLRGPSIGVYLAGRVVGFEEKEIKECVGEGRPRIDFK